MKVIKKPKKHVYKDTKVQHYEHRLCLGSVEPGYASPKASV